LSVDQLSVDQLSVDQLPWSQKIVTLDPDLIAGEKSCKTIAPGTNPKVVSFYASAVKIYNKATMYVA
jgi:hypothetical protein